LIDGPLLPFKCTMPSAETNECPHQGKCVMTSVWHDVRNAIEIVLEEINFEELSRRREHMNSPMYHI